MSIKKYMEFSTKAPPATRAFSFIGSVPTGRMEAWRAAGHRFQPCPKLLDEGAAARRRARPAGTRGDRDDELVLRIEAQVDMRQREHRSENQPGGNEEHNRQRDLRDDERRACTVASRRGAETSAAPGQPISLAIEPVSGAFEDALWYTSRACLSTPDVRVDRPVPAEASCIVA